MVDAQLFPYHFVKVLMLQPFLKVYLILYISVSIHKIPVGSLTRYPIIVS